jgi:hypothetical protein
MAGWDDVRRLALGLPGSEERVRPDGTSQWRVADKLFVWERPLRRGDLAALGLSSQGRPVLAARVEDVGVRTAMIADDPDVCFTIPHFATYPAVLLWLNRADVDLLSEVVIDAWRARAPARLLSRHQQD